MSSYHIAKDGKQTGPIDEETVRQQIATGALAPSDLCWRGGMADWQPIGTVFGIAAETAEPGPIPVQSPSPASPTEAAASCPHQLKEFPVAVAVLLHFVTLGIFTPIWLNLMHGKMCRVRVDDPSAGKAVGFCFIPFFNLYWIFFTYRRLCLRIDEQRDLYGLPPGNHRGLATTACIFQVIPYINFLLGYTIITPVFIGMMQSSVNQLARTSATTLPRTTLPASLEPAPGMSGGAVAAIVCACLIPFTGLMAAIAIPSFMKARQTAQQNACVHNLRQIDSGKEQAALANRWADQQAVDVKTVNNYIKGNATPICPAGGEYTYGRMGENPTCSTPGHNMPSY